MAAFNYRALNSEGREVKGVIEAETSRIARGLLRDQSLAPVEVSAAGRRSADRPYGGGSKIGTSSLSLLTRQWSTLLAAGLTVERSLTALIEQTEDRGVQEVLGGVRAEVIAGHSLHAALGRYEDVFPPIYRALINAGEKSGELPVLLARLADYLEASQATRQKILQALLYPAIVVVVALAVITGLVTYVVPQIVGVFAQNKQTLPLLTRALILVSDVVRNSGVWLALAAVGAGVLAKRALKNETLRLRWHARLLRLPLLGRFLRTVDSARFASTMAILVGSGVPLLAALETGKGVIGNLVLRRSVERAIGFVREGTPLHRALASERVFPPLLIHLIASGEATGTLDQMLARAAQQQQIELDHRTALALGLFEPLLILLMGGLVLLIVLAVLLPIININVMLR